MFTAKKVYTMLENESLWQAALQCHQLLAAAKIPHAVMGGVAVCLHGYQRNTRAVDLLVRGEDSERIQESIVRSRRKWKVALRIYFAGQGGTIALPDPANRRTTTQIEGLPVLRLSKLIEWKIACGMGNPRRTHKDFADVVELIDHHRLNGSFARHLHKSVRAAYRGLVRNSRGKE